jgi:hypothetical protein
MSAVEPFPSQQRSIVFLCDRPPCHLLAESADGSRKEPA